MNVEINSLCFTVVCKYVCALWTHCLCFVKRTYT